MTSEDIYLCVNVSALWTKFETLPYNQPQKKRDGCSAEVVRIRATDFILQSYRINEVKFLSSFSIYHFFV